MMGKVTRQGGRRSVTLYRQWRLQLMRCKGQGIGGGIGWEGERRVMLEAEGRGREKGPTVYNNV